METPMEDVIIQSPGANNQNLYTANDGLFSISSLLCNQDNSYDSIINSQQTTLIPASTLPDGTVLYQPITQEQLDQAPGIMIDNVEDLALPEPPPSQPLPNDNNVLTQTSSVSFEITNALSSPIESSTITQAALAAGLITDSHAAGPHVSIIQAPPTSGLTSVIPVKVTQASLAAGPTCGPHNTSEPVSVTQAPLAAGLTSGPQIAALPVSVTQAPLAAGLTSGPHNADSPVSVTQAPLAAGLTSGPQDGNSSVCVPQAPLAASLIPGSSYVTQASLAAGLTKGPSHIGSSVAALDETLNTSKPISSGIAIGMVQSSSAAPNEDNNNNNYKPSSAAPHKDNNNNKIPQPSIGDKEVENDVYSDDDSDTSVLCNIIPPTLQPRPNTISPMNCDKDNVINILKPGIQVCAFEYNILPPVGIYYRVNKNHHLVKVVIEPGVIYQADDECNLYKLGLPYTKNSSD
jgi:hypothetical protein